MGLIHGGSTSGCRYGYFSDFGEFDSSFTAQTSLCEGDSLNFQGPFIQDAVYSWNGPDGFTSDIQNPVIENITSVNQGEYTLEIIVDEVCTSTSSMQIEIIPRPSNFDISEISICDYTYIEDLLLDYSNINIYNSPALSQSLSPNTALTAGVYYITQLNEFGCESINALDVYMSCFPNIPDAFSPNNDGFNDYFNIQNLYNVFIDHKLEIFNRYGSLIFEGDNSNKWYGTTKHSNEKAPVGTYFYKLSLNNIKNDIITGWVYLNY
jgi:gliding motility-associated-like protein